MMNVENACASGSSAVIGAAAMIRSGEAELAIAFGVEKLTRPGGGFLPIVADDLESAMGRVMPAAFAMQAQLHMRRYGTTRQQMAQVAVKNRRNGALNPRCHFKEEVTVAQVLASPSIAEPLTRLSCCPVSDGAAAVILASGAALRRLGIAPRVELAASALVSGERTPYGIVDDPEGGEGTGLGPALRAVAERGRRRGLVAVFSDLFDDVEALAGGLKRLRYNGHEVVVFHTLDGAEVEFPFEDATLFRGLEGAPDVLTDPRGVRRDYLARFGAFREQVRSACRARDVDLVELRTDKPLDAALAGYLAGRLRR